MKLAIYITLSLLTFSSCSAQESPFEEYQWKNRLLVFYVSGKEGNGIYKQQNELLMHQHAAFKERDLKGVLVLDSLVLKLPQGSKLDVTVASCKNFLAVKDESIFQVSLIGKDGTIKLLSNSPITPEKLYETIDAMPMRRREMHNEKE